MKNYTEIFPIITPGYLVFGFHDYIIKNVTSVSVYFKNIANVTICRLF